MKNVGAQRPTKIPKRSAWAWDSGAVPPVRNQMAMEPMIDAKPRTKQRLLSMVYCAGFMVLICVILDHLLITDNETFWFPDGDASFELAEV